LALIERNEESAPASDPSAPPDATMRNTGPHTRD
jgi:hypothetical protein